MTIWFIKYIIIFIVFVIYQLLHILNIIDIIPRSIFLFIIHPLYGISWILLLIFLRIIDGKRENYLYIYYVF